MAHTLWWWSRVIFKPSFSVPQQRHPSLEAAIKHVRTQRSVEEHWRRQKSTKCPDALKPLQALWEERGRGPAVWSRHETEAV